MSMKLSELADKLCMQPSSVSKALNKYNIKESGRYSDRTLNTFLHRQRVKQARQYYKKKYYAMPPEILDKVNFLVLAMIREHEKNL